MSCLWQPLLPFIHKTRFNFPACLVISNMATHFPVCRLLSLIHKPFPYTDYTFGVLAAHACCLHWCLWHLVCKLIYLWFVRSNILFKNVNKKGNYFLNSISKKKTLHSMQSIIKSYKYVTLWFRHWMAIPAHFPYVCEFLPPWSFTG